MYSEFLAQVRSQPTVWQDVQRAQKSLPQDVSKSIEAMFSGAGRKEGFFESVTFAGVPAMNVFAGTSFERETADSSKSVEPTPLLESTDSEKAITLASGTIREGAYTGSSQGCKSYLQSDLPSWQSYWSM